MALAPRSIFGLPTGRVTGGFGLGIAVLLDQRHSYGSDWGEGGVDVEYGHMSLGIPGVIGIV